MIKEFPQQEATIGKNKDFQVLELDAIWKKVLTQQETSQEERARFFELMGTLKAGEDFDLVYSDDVFPYLVPKKKD